jgi:sulfur-oxidizing protein SoxY
MDHASAPFTFILGRRRFLGLAGAAAGLALRPAWASGAVGAEEAPAPILRLPAATANGDKVPIVVELDHPMTPDHHVTRLEVRVARGLRPAKGVFELSPGNGRAYVAFQARLPTGVSEVTVAAECSRHGRSTTRRTIEVREHVDCAGRPAPLERTGGDDVHAPELRIAELVQHGHLAPGDVVHAQVKLRHPSRPDLHLKSLDVRYGGEPVSRFALGPAVSEDPFLGFALVTAREATLEVVLVNSRGQRLEASQAIRFA